MAQEHSDYWAKIKNLGVFSMAFPVFILILSVFLSNREIPALVEDFEEGMARIVQYILFAIGVVIFFFCEGISDFFCQRFFSPEKDQEEENLSSYFAYVFIMLWILNMISVMGFVGFLISANFTWLTIFVILTLFLQMKYFPSEGRFKKLVQSSKK